MSDNKALGIALDALEFLEPSARALLKEYEEAGTPYQRKWFIAWQQAAEVMRALDKIRSLPDGKIEEPCQTTA